MQLHTVTLFEIHIDLITNFLQCTQEAKGLLRDALTFKAYDFENRLLVHVQKELRKLE